MEAGDVEQEMTLSWKSSIRYVSDLKDGQTVIFFHNVEYSKKFTNIPYQIIFNNESVKARDEELEAGDTVRITIERIAKRAITSFPPNVID